MSSPRYSTWAVVLAARPRSARIRAVLVALVASALVPLSAVSAHAQPAPVTSVTAVDNEGDTAGFYGHATWTGTSQVSVSGDPSTGITVSTNRSGPDYAVAQFQFAAPDGQTLTVGTYDDARHIGTDAGDHPGMLVTGHVNDPHSPFEDCRDLSGSFTVLDLDPDLDQLLIRYEEHCNGSDDAVTGEIRYQEPGGDDELLVAPGELVWPATYRDATHPEPLTLVNTGAAPLQVGSPTIAEGADEFSVLDSSCETLAPGDSCVVTVGFTPRSGGGHRGLLTVGDSTSSGRHTVPLSGSEFAGYTSWQMHSQDGDSIGLGRDYTFDPSYVDFGTSGKGTVTIRAYNYDAEVFWDASFGSTSRLHEGTYSTGVDGPGVTGGSSLHVDSGASCGNEPERVKGSFTITELTHDQHGLIASFAATFSQACRDLDGTTQPELLGSIVYHASQPPADVPAGDLISPRLTAAPSRATATDGEQVTLSGRLYAGGRSGRRIDLYSRAHGSAGWRAVGSTTIPDYGFHPYTLTAKIEQTSDYQVRFAGDRDFSPSVSPVVTVSARWRPALRGPYAARRSIQRRLVASVPHGVRGQHVGLQVLRSGRWTALRRVSLSSSGTVALDVARPRGRAYYRLYVPAGRLHLAAVSPAVLVR